MTWAIFKENVKNDKQDLIFEKNKKYAIQHEDDKYYHIAIMPDKDCCTQCCKMSVSQENKLFITVDK